MCAFRQSRQITERCRQLGTYLTSANISSVLIAYLEISQHIHPSADGRRTYRESQMPAQRVGPQYTGINGPPKKIAEEEEVEELVWKNNLFEFNLHY